MKYSLSSVLVALYLVLPGFAVDIGNISAEINSESCQENGSCLSYRVGVEEDGSRVDLRPALVHGQEWLLTNVRENGGWGLSTHRVVTTLGLTASNHVLHEGKLKLHLKEMELQIALALARNEKQHLSLYINALLSICENPRDFHGFDLVSKLLEYAKEGRFVSEYEKALVHLALCNAGVHANSTGHKRIITRVHKYSKKDDAISDTSVMHTLALICFSKHDERGSELYEKRVKKAIQILKSKQNELDGSFGNLYTSSLVVQVMNAAQTDDIGWNATLAREFILSHQKDDGSFQSYTAASFALLALDGKSLIINIGSCEAPHEDVVLTLPKSTPDEEEFHLPDNEIDKDIETEVVKLESIPVVHKKVEIIFVDLVRIVGNVTLAVTETVKNGTSLYDILANCKSFHCGFKETTFGTMLTSVDNLLQNADEKAYWAILKRSVNSVRPSTFKDEFLTLGVKEFYPKDADIIVLKYVKYE